MISSQQQKAKRIQEEIYDQVQFEHLNSEMIHLAEYSHHPCFSPEKMQIWDEIRNPSADSISIKYKAIIRSRERHKKLSEDAKLKQKSLKQKKREEKKLEKAKKVTIEISKARNFQNIEENKQIEAIAQKKSESKEITEESLFEPTLAQIQIEDKGLSNQASKGKIIKIALIFDSDFSLNSGVKVIVSPGFGLLLWR